ncbi:MAG: hypothetical protein NTW87_31495 [Planctomycetota bacterium]|nr:hypothetical protein [Planctomycetota bacterium]
MTHRPANPSPLAEQAPALPLPPARAPEFVGRLVICISLAALLYALWSPRLEAAAAWTDKELRVLPRMSVFVLGALVALILQGARPSGRALLGLGLLAAASALGLLPWAELWGMPAAAPDGELAADSARCASDGGVGAGRLMLLAGPCLQWLRFEVSFFSALLLGTWLGRGIRSSSQLVMLLLCAVAGDVWLSTFHVPESAAATNPLRLLRLPWPPVVGHLGLSPAFTDLLILSATVEAGRNLQFHMLSVVLGAVAGYSAASFLALEPWPAWPALSMLMLTSGVLVACWPDLKCSARDMGRALLAGAVVLAALLAIASLHRALHPVPEPPANPARYHQAV